MNRLLRVLSARTDYHTGIRVSASGNFPLTVTGTFGGFPLRGYGVQGAVQTNITTTPVNPVPPVFAGETILAGGGRGLSLVLSTEGADGGGSTVTATFPTVEPLRAVGTVRDELDYAGQRVIRRIGVCRNPTVQPGPKGTAGTPYPAVTLSIGGTTTPPSLTNLLSTHWTKIRGSDLSEGTVPGYAVRSGALCANLPRAVYRRYVTGCVGETSEENERLVSNVGAGEYRCDFSDGTSRVFTLSASLDGIEDETADLIAVSRDSATLVKNIVRREILSSDDFTVLQNYKRTGETIIQIERSTLGGTVIEDDDEGTGAFSSHFLFDWMTPRELINEYPDDPAFCGDGENLYFHHPDVYDAADFRAYLNTQRLAGKPVTVVLPAEEQTATTLSSYAAPTASVSSVTRLDAVAGGSFDDYLFDLEADYTLVPAFRSFLADESAAGRGVEIYFQLPSVDVTECAIDLPPLLAREGSTTFTARAADPGGLDPTAGTITALAEE